jgi:hypothetical protein
MRGGKRPLSVGRVESAFPPATNHYATLRLICKENSTNGFSQIGGGAYRAGWKRFSIALNRHCEDPRT